MSRLNPTRWLQFRLSTALVVMCVAAVLLGLNTLPQTRTEILIQRSHSVIPGLFISGDVYRSFGWPVRHSTNEPHWHCMSTWSHLDVETDRQLVECRALPDGLIELDELSRRAPSLVPLVTAPHEPGTLLWENVLLNFSLAMGILFATAFFCECLAQRRPNSHSAFRNPQ